MKLKLINIWSAKNLMAKNCNLSFEDALKELGLPLTGKNLKIFSQIIDEALEKAKNQGDDIKRAEFIKKYRERLIKEVNEAEKLKVKNALLDAAIEIELT